MERNHLFSMALAAATLGLTACGGNDIVPTSGGGTTTVPPITPATVACAAPTVAEIASGPFNGSQYASVCIPAASGSGSSRYDINVFGTASGVRLNKMDFTNALCSVGGASAGSAFGSIQIASNTTTVASLGTDGITPVTGSGRTVNFTISGTVTGTFPAGVPLLTSGIYTFCKTTPPSTTASRIVTRFGDGSNREFTPAFVLRSSSVDASAINTAFGFDGNATGFSFYE